MLLLCKDTVHVHRGTTPLSKTSSSSNWMPHAQEHKSILLVLLHWLDLVLGACLMWGIIATTVHCRLRVLYYCTALCMCVTVYCVLLHCTLHVCYCILCVTVLHSTCVLLYSVCYCTALCMCYCTALCMCVTVYCVLLYCTLHVCDCILCILLYCTLHVCYNIYIYIYIYILWQIKQTKGLRG